MTWTPETNRVSTGLLTPEELNALRSAEHGWEYHSYWRGEWLSVENPNWHKGNIYRAKPAPKRVVVWHNVYPDGMTHGYDTRDEADQYAESDRICVYRIERNENGSDPQIFVEEV